MQQCFVICKPKIGKILVGISLLGPLLLRLYYWLNWLT
jgi:hypothetical protein